MKLLLFVLLILSCSPLAHGQTFPFREESSHADGADQGRLILELKDTTLKRDETYLADYTFYVPYSIHEVYNCTFNRLIPLPGQLAVYNEKKEYVGDLFYSSGGSRRLIEDYDWTVLYDGAHVGCHLSVNFGRQNLPSGVYFIQLILYRAFISPDPYRVVNEPVDFHKTYDRRELCRSNVIKVEVVDQ